LVAGQTPVHTGFADAYIIGSDPDSGFHVVPLHGREMASSLSRRLPRGGGAVAFIPIDRPLRGADMPQIGRRKNGFSDFQRFSLPNVRLDTPLRVKTFMY